MYFMANVHYLRTTQVFPPIMQLFHFRRLLVTQISQDQKIYTLCIQGT